jgi:hypothetical protein
VFCVFQPYRARPMANGGRGRVGEGTGKARQSDKVGARAQAKARKPRRRGRAEQSRTPGLQRTTVAVLLPVLVFHSSTAPQLHSLPPHTPSPSSLTSCTCTIIIRPSPHNAGISLQPFRGAASSYLSCPPRPPVLHTRAVNLFLSAALFSLFFRS